MMKGKKGARLVKQIISMVSCVSRAKYMALRNKTDDVKARITVTALTVLSKKKTISAKINHAIDGILFKHDMSKNDEDEQAETSKAIVLYSNKAETSNYCGREEYYHEDVDDNKYPDLTHTLFDEEDKEIADLLDDPNASISAIDIVKNSKENGDKFNLEDEINEVADLFITKFHKRMRLQKLLSFKRYQQMMEKSAASS